MSIAIRRALYGKLAGDTTLDAMLGSPPAGFAHAIYHQEAPAGAGFPYVIFHKQSGTPVYALLSKAYDNEMWLVKGVDRTVAGAIIDSDRVDGIATRLDALLTDGTLSISGARKLYLRRDSDVEYPESLKNERFSHAGALYRLAYEPT